MRAESRLCAYARKIAIFIEIQGRALQQRRENTVSVQNARLLITTFHKYHIDFSINRLKGLAAAAERSNLKPNSRTILDDYGVFVRSLNRR